MRRLILVVALMVLSATSAWAQGADSRPDSNVTWGWIPEEAVPAAPALAANATGPSSCIAMATPDLDATPPLLTLEGNFCEDPVVYMGRPGGFLEEVAVLASGATFIELDLTGAIDPATYLVVVLCGKDTCAMDVTLGAEGPAGPAGPTGPTGPEGPQGADGAQGKFGKIFSRQRFERKSRRRGHPVMVMGHGIDTGAISVPFILKNLVCPFIRLIE